MDIKILKAAAKAKVNMAHRAYLNGNHMIYPAVIAGMDTYGIEAFPGAGHHFDFVIDAIYEKYDEDNDPQVAVAFKEAIYKLMEVVNGFPSLERLERIISYMNKKEQKGEAKIDLNIEEINTKFSNLIDEKYEILKNDNPQLDNWIARIKQIFWEDYEVEISTKH
ncbi:hypothetical protein [Butyrivibrio sp. XBB1001]|uniref:hypothetical protein n=1 Tax=Butyrivibrio sp. XBB1001 TaxID=1280682 RepID=UPI00042A67BE|nr:hypothetical protein [Butyrivibrio sp. XBB1001]